MSVDYDLKEKAEYENIYYLKGSKRLDNDEYASICQEKDSINAYARLAINTRTEEENCFIKLYEGNVIDPYNDNLRFSKRDRFTYKRVSTEIFDMYVRYLQNGARHLYNNVNRNAGV